MYAYTCTHTHTHTHTRTCVHTHAHTHIRMCTPITYTHMDIQTCKHIHSHTRTYTHHITHTYIAIHFVHDLCPSVYVFYWCAWSQQCRHGWLLKCAMGDRVGLGHYTNTSIVEKFFSSGWISRISKLLPLCDVVFTLCYSSC